MQKNLLSAISIVAACVVVCASFSSVVGVQLVKSSNNQVRNDAIDQKELLFQTIVDMANNKEIQKVILGVELIGKRSFEPGMRFSTFTFPVITEKFLKHAYTMGILLSRTPSKSKIHSMHERYQVNNQAVQKELAAVIEKDTVLKKEMMQLSSLSCGCDNGNVTTWTFPVICTILLIINQFWNFIENFIGQFLPFPWYYVLFWFGFILISIYEFFHCS
jgi:hypothetical protein